MLPYTHTTHSRQLIFSALLVPDSLPGRERSRDSTSPGRNNPAAQGHVEGHVEKGYMARPVWRVVSKGVEYGHRLPALQAGHSRNDHKAISGGSPPAGSRRVGHGRPE
jgi:hypothetical protein